jgi:hypothetical protein
VETSPASEIGEGEGERRKWARGQREERIDGVRGLIGRSELHPGGGDGKVPSATAKLERRLKYRDDYSGGVVVAVEAGEGDKADTDALFFPVSGELAGAGVLASAPGPEARIILEVLAITAERHRRLTGTYL